MKGYLLIITLLATTVLTAQNPAPLAIGNRCPDLSFTEVRNTGRPALKLSDYRGKHLVLLFSGIGCPAVIDSFPAWQRLQQQFGKDLQIIVFNSNKPQGWQKLAARNAHAKAFSLPLVLADTVLATLFPHRETPHLVWLDRDRRVTAITTDQYLNRANIKSFLKGEPNNWLVKADRGQHDFSRPLLQLSEGEAETPFYSILTAHKRGTPLGKAAVVDSVANWQRITWINVTLADLVRESAIAPGRRRLMNNRIMWEGIDSAKFFYDPAKMYKDQWRLKNTWCYELRLPLVMKAELVKQTIRADLARYLGVDLKEEKREVRTYVLYTTEKKGVPVSVKGTKIRFRTMASLVEVLNLAHPLPVVDESGIKDKINLPDMGPAVWDISDVRAFLAPYGIGIKEEVRELEMIVVRQK